MPDVTREYPGTELDAVDRALINTLQGGLAVRARPYAALARDLAISEDEVLRRLRNLLDRGVLTRVGPMFDAGRMGGAAELAAMRVPPAELDAVAGLINSFPEVAHNYARDHEFNLWFVLAAERPERIAEVVVAIEAGSGYPVMRLPKRREFHVGLYLPV